jgi:hypothetical protein
MVVGGICRARGNATAFEQASVAKVAANERITNPQGAQTLAKVK